MLTREVATPAAAECSAAVFSPSLRPPETPGFQRLWRRPAGPPTATSIDGPHASSLSSPSVKRGDAAATSPPLFIDLDVLQVDDPRLKWKKGRKKTCWRSL